MMLADLTDRGDPPYLWGDWRANANPDFFTAWCAACGADLWLCWSVGRWRVVCVDGCALEDIDAAAGALLEAQRRRQQYEAELRATMEPDDPFYTIDAERYIEALTGLEARRGYFRCPFHGDGLERTPSLHATDRWWYCHACHAGGSIYDFGARLWDIEPRRDGFHELRRRLAATLLVKAGERL